MISTIKKKDEPKEEVKPIEGKTSTVNSMVLIPKKRNSEEGLMFVDINIVVRSGVLLLIREHQTCSYRKRLRRSLVCRLRNRIRRLRQ
ncbi:hypothetical protein Gogos_021297 [Gossypium gossypioides]|uniref:Uncharacterized protein n=1 Tax=Gossypium gossypioides TaxID=34282 RepID=A0A7J9D674_GOSGO|nr:hypothetical protein [Gossypium gossypioides]